MDETSGLIGYGMTMLKVFESFNQGNYISSIYVSYNGKGFEYINSEDVEAARFIGWVGKGEWSGSAGSSCKTGDLIGKKIDIDITFGNYYLSDNHNKTEKYYIEFKKIPDSQIATVKYMLDGTEYATRRVIIGNKTEKISVTNSAYAWFKWMLNGEEFDFDKPVENSITLIGTYEIKKFTATFDVRGGTPEYPDQIIEYGGTITKPSTNPTREGYTFNSWYYIKGDKEYKFSFSTKIYADYQIVANWNAKRITLTYNPMGGKMPDSTVRKYVYYDSPYGEFKIPTKEGYEFIGWFSEQTGGTQFTEDMTVKLTQNATIYAHWK